LSPEISTSINIHVPFSLLRVMLSGILLWIVLSVCSYCFHSMIPCLLGLFLLVFVHATTSVLCSIIPLLLLVVVVVVELNVHF
jgi:predicted benzoate:H+ symporter BenE